MWFDLLCLTFCLVIVFAGLSVLGMKRKHIIKMLAFFCIILSLIATFRGDNARDMDIYQAYYNQAPALDSIIQQGMNESLSYTSREKGFVLLNVFVKEFIGQQLYVLLLVASMSLFLYYKSFKSWYVRYPLVSFLVYFGFMFLVKECTQIRQGVAIAFFFFSIRYLLLDDWKKFVLCILCGSLFHYSLPPVLALWFLRNVKWNLKKCVKYLVAIIFVVKIDWMNGFINILSSIDDESRILQYGNTLYAIDNDFSQTLHFILIFPILVFMRKFIIIGSLDMKVYDLMLSALALGLMYTSFFHEFIFVGQRVAYPLYMSFALLFPTMITFCKDIRYKLAAYSVVVAISCYFFINRLEMLLI